MDSPASKAPPRYVPTLTDVVAVPEGVQAHATVPAPTAAPTVPLRAPQARMAGAGDWSEPVGAGGAPPQATGTTATSEQELMERLALTLQQRLDAAIEQSVQEQTDAFAQRLRQTLQITAQLVLQETLQEVRQTRRQAQRPASW